MTTYRQSLKSLWVGALLALATVLYGQGMGIAFGAAEDSIKASLDARAAAVLDTVYGGDTAKKDKVVAKSWTYFKRAHLHAGGIGTTALVLVLLLAALGGPLRARQGAAAAVGLGGLGYALFWELAGLRAPGLGGTGAAKQSLFWLAGPSSILIVAGTATTAVLLLKSQPWKRPAA